MITKLPLQIDTSDPVAMERALRIYCGVPLINSVSGRDRIAHNHSAAGKEVWRGACRADA